MIIGSRQSRTDVLAFTASLQADDGKAQLSVHEFTTNPVNAPKHWQLVMLDSAAAHSRNSMANSGFAPLMPLIYLGSADATQPKDALVLSPVSLPRWLAE